MSKATTKLLEELRIHFDYENNVERDPSLFAAYQKFAESINLPSKVEGTELYRTEFKVVVLSDSPVNEMSLSEIAHDIDSGDSVGQFKLVDMREISKLDMAEQLEDQGSDAEFLLGDDAWLYGLHNGDEVEINMGDDHPATIIISTIEYGPNDTFTIVDKEGGQHEGFMKDIS